MRINCRFRIEVTGRRGRQGKISRSSGSEMGKSVPVSSAKLYFFQKVMCTGGLPGGSVVKNPPANVGDVGSIPRLGRAPGKGNGNPLQYSCLDRGVYSSWGRRESDTTEQLTLHFFPINESF